MISMHEIRDKYPISFSPKVHHINIELSEKILLDIKEVLDSEGIPFWLWAGTLLGIYRSGNLIPWDGDIDLAIYSEDIQRVIQCENKFNDKGFELAVNDHLLLYRDGEHTDLDHFRLDGDKRIRDFYEYGKEEIFCTAETPAISFEIPNCIEFLSKTWRIFTNPEKVLECIYGPDWRIPNKDFPQGLGLYEQKLEMMGRK